MQCTASVAIMRMASLSSCPVPVQANSVGESSPCCHDFPFRPYSHLNGFFPPAYRVSKRAATAQPCDKYTIRQVLLNPGGPREAKVCCSEPRPDHAPCPSRGSLQPTSCKPAPLRSFYHPVPECVHGVESAQPFQRVGDERVSVNCSVQGRTAGRKPPAFGDELLAWSKVCDQKPGNNGSRHPEIDSPIGYPPDFGLRHSKGRCDTSPAA